MKNLREMVGDVIEQRLNPKFDSIGARFEAIENRLGTIDARLDGIDGRLERIEDDVTVIKQVVKDHSFEIARLKHKTA